MERVLLIANFFARSVTEANREAIQTALSADFDLEVAKTESREHASELAREGVSRGFHAVFAFGGDGTVNEVAQSLIGTDVAMGVLPGGTGNVIARSLGLPNDPVEASALAAARLRSGNRRRINVGRLDERYFIANTGMGLDAEVVKRTEANPEGKRKWGEMLFLAYVLRVALSSEYRGGTPPIALQVDGDEQQRALLVICCNLHPFTYFKRWEVDTCPRARLELGLDFVGLSKLSALMIGPLCYSLFKSGSHIGWRTCSYNHDAREAILTADHPIPVQVDGDFIGEREKATIRLVPQALDLLI